LKGGEYMIDGGVNALEKEIKDM